MLLALLGKEVLCWRVAVGTVLVLTSLLPNWGHRVALPTPHQTALIARQLQSVPLLQAECAACSIHWNTQIVSPLHTDEVVCHSGLPRDFCYLSDNINIVRFCTNLQWLQDKKKYRLTQTMNKVWLNFDCYVILVPSFRILLPTLGSFTVYASNRYFFLLFYCSFLQFTEAMFCVKTVPKLRIQKKAGCFNTELFNLCHRGSSPKPNKRRQM